MNADVFYQLIHRQISILQINKYRASRMEKYSKDLLVIQVYVFQNKKLKDSAQIYVYGYAKVNEVKALMMGRKCQPYQNYPNWQNFVIVCEDVRLSNDLKISQVKACMGDIDKTLILRIYPIDQMPQSISDKILILWIDPVFAENLKTYNFIVSKGNFEQKFQLIQLQSNLKLKQYLVCKQNKINILYQMRKLFFISNMNRAPNFSNQGLETLKMARQGGRDTQLFIFYTGDEKKCWATLQEAKKQQLYTYEVQVVSKAQKLYQFFVHNFLNQNLQNQSKISITTQQDN